ncbi:MAG: ATP-binding protein [Gammaproteobacteria bacterium]|nr:ATP-binding protein [Gammaproteobacteria bacterium]
MSLRTQLLGLGILITLSLPWVTYIYVQGSEGSLRDTTETLLRNEATSIAQTLGSQILETTWTTNVDIDSGITLYAHKLESQPELDGNRQDWQLPDNMANFKVGQNGVLWLGLYEFNLNLFLSISDNNLASEPFTAVETSVDKIILLIEGGENLALLLHPASQQAQRSEPPEWAISGDYEDRVQFSWRKTQNGHAIEALMPLQIGSQPIKRIGVAIINANEEDIANDANSWATLIEPSQMLELWQGEDRPGKLFYPQIQLASAIRQVFDQQDQPNRRLRVANTEGWILFDGGSVNTLGNTANNIPLSFSESFYSFIIRRSDPRYDTLEVPHARGKLSDTTLRTAINGESEWYSHSTEGSAIVMASSPIYNITESGSALMVGSVILEQSNSAILTLNNTRMVSFMTSTLVLTLLVFAALLSYATWLSIRVQKLAQAADCALGPKGEIRPNLPDSKARDEIGELSRSFTSLLDQADKNINYQFTLNDKLSHELRTPLSIVASSLEHIEYESKDKKLVPYLERLRKGVERLETTLEKMSVATRTKQTISDTTLEIIDLLEILPGCIEAYSDIYGDRFRFEQTAPRTNIEGSGELIEQMLDKLIDNAVSFSKDNSPINILLSGKKEQILLSVTNKGPLLPEKIRGQLFDPLVSMRETRGESLHLGHGLYIVRLIAEHHNGKVEANDLKDGTGVKFEIALPVSIS